MDNKIFELFFNLSQDKTIEGVAFFTSYILPYVLVLSLVYYVLFKAHKKISTFSYLFLSGFSALFLSEGIKMFLVKNRPFVDLNLIPIYTENSFSFPSTHTTLFFALATSLLFLNKKWSIFFFFCAILIGISRIVLGLHYPIDVLGGIILGVFIGLIFSKIFKRI